MSAEKGINTIFLGTVPFKKEGLADLILFTTISIQKLQESLAGPAFSTSVGQLKYYILKWIRLIHVNEKKYSLLKGSHYFYKLFVHLTNVGF